jgi:hypothetical protein
VPTGLKITEVEIAQARDLNLDSLPIRLSRTDLDARHFSQAKRRFDCRPVGLALSTSPMQ